jgi:hypothetical protein
MILVVLQIGKAKDLSASLRIPATRCVMQCEVHEEHFYEVGAETPPIRFRPFRLYLLIALQYTYFFFIWDINIRYTSTSLVFGFFPKLQTQRGDTCLACTFRLYQYIPEAYFTDCGQENDPTATSDLTFRTMKFIYRIFEISIEKFSDFLGNRTRDLPACSIVPQPTTLPHK